jgi:hypothetical protein
VAYSLGQAAGSLRRGGLGLHHVEVITAMAQSRLAAMSCLGPPVIEACLPAVSTPGPKAAGAPQSCLTLQVHNECKSHRTSRHVDSQGIQQSSKTAGRSDPRAYLRHTFAAHTGCQINRPQLASGSQSIDMHNKTRLCSSSCQPATNHCADYLYSRMRALRLRHTGHLSSPEAQVTHTCRQATGGTHTLSLSELEAANVALLRLRATSHSNAW